MIAAPGFANLSCAPSLNTAAETPPITMRHPYIIVAAALAALGAPSTALSAGAKIEATVAGPTNQGGIYTISPGGGHIAYMGAKGTHFAVTVDGVEGPMFDELYGPNGQGFYLPEKAAVMRSSPGGEKADVMVPVIFSPDGAHYAYAARLGAEYVVIHDGQEAGRGPRAALALNYGWLTLSPTGRRVFWDEMKQEGARGTWRLMMEGKPGPWSGHQITNPVFCADDSRYAYSAAKVENYQEQVLVVDGKIAGYAGQTPVFTADGSLLLTISYAGGKAAVLVDGKPVVGGIQVDQIIPSPVGHRWGAIVRTKLVNGMGVSTFFLDGKEVPGTDGTQNAWFSADGKHYAVACTNAATRAMYMLIDGRRQNEYPAVATDKIYWTPDGSIPIYTASSAGRQFLIVNAEEIPITTLMSYDPIAMAAVGSRYAFATRDGTNRNFTLVVDGKSVLPAGTYPVDNSFTFSPDGSRFGYFFGPVGRSEITGIVVDGVTQSDLTPAYFGKWQTSTLVAPAFAFSPDGKHVAFMARPASAPRNALYLDGHPVYPGARAVFFPSFTPDSQHLFWAADEPAKVQGQPPSIVVYVDGQEAVRANGYFFQQNPGTFDMDRNGVVTYLAADGDVAKRYRITAPAETSVATLIADAAAAQAKALAEAQAAKDKALADAKAAQEAKAAAAAKAKADALAAAAARQKAQQDAIVARARAAAEKNWKAENARRAKLGLPPLPPPADD